MLTNLPDPGRTTLLIMHEWNDFYVAVAGAAAALTGLLFVGISINLEKILSNPILTTRASISLVLLLSILIFSVLLLVPRETLALTGYGVTIAGCIVWIVITRADIKIYRQAPKEYKWLSLLYLFFDQLAVLPYIFAGLLILSIGNAGFYYMVPAFVLSFIKAVLDAWVLLIEIKR